MPWVGKSMDRKRAVRAQAEAAAPFAAVQIERVFELSRVRRGRRATSPVFKVTAPSGERWRFGRRKDAQAFIDRGCLCVAHHHLACLNCGGSVDVRAPA